MKEMPLEEKYNKLLDAYWLNVIGSYAHLKELGAVDKGVESSVKVNMKMFPSRVGIAFDLLKVIAPGTAFKHLVDNYVYSLQSILSPQDIEVDKVSDHEAVYRITNCPTLKRVKSLIDKTGLDVDPKAICEIESRITQGVANEFEVNLVTELKENGCIKTAKLRSSMYIWQAT
jgi:hypothetical protein